MVSKVQKLDLRVMAISWKVKKEELRIVSGPSGAKVQLKNYGWQQLFGKLEERDFDVLNRKKS